MSLKSPLFFLHLACFALLVGLFAVACDRSSQKEPDGGALSSQEESDGGAQKKEKASQTSSPSAPSSSKSSKQSDQQVAHDAEEGTSEPSCPEGMTRVPGGQFWVGTERETYNREENPRFRTTLPSFCADIYEVTAKEYERCVAKGKCSPSHARYKTCNTVDKGRGEHPINCIDHGQARAYCEFKDARLPTEIEWEYMARGGSEMRKYPWGDGPVDGNTCWKSHQSCEVGSYTEGAFGLHDVVGNVWEWTDSWFGRYPWPNEEGRHKVYRGGSWSRRFDKWMRAGLRNRLDPEKHGSHLGVRCVADWPAAKCPYGKDPETDRCRFGIDEVSCLDGKKWNGVRCAAPGDDRRCPPGAEEVAGHGCVRERIRGPIKTKLDTASVVRQRSPQFDADCENNAPGRPHAYRLTGGGHLARNAVGKKLGCKNRDVGVGWNSACCP